MDHGARFFWPFLSSFTCDHQLNLFVGWRDRAIEMHMQIRELVSQIVAKRAERGFVTDPLKLHVLLTEEVGEIAAELKRLWSKNYSAFNPAKLAEEIADVFCLLAALAHEFDIDIERAVEEKFFKADESRTWNSAAQPIAAPDADKRRR